MVNSSEELTLEEIKSIVDQSFPWTLVALSGGEIFVRKDIMDIIAAIARKRHCHIYTNGTYISREIAKQLIDLGVSSISVSIDGPEHIHDKIRGQGTFYKAAEAVRFLVHYKKTMHKRFPLVNFKTTITHDNVAYLADCLNVAETLGTDYCTFQTLNSSLMIGGVFLKDNPDYSQLPAPIEEFPVDVLEKQLSLIGKRSTMSNTRIRFIPGFTNRQIVNHYANLSDIRGFGCVTPWLGMNINAIGDVFPCLNFRIGSLRRERLMTIWNNESFRRFRLMLIKEGLFPHCIACCDLVRT